MKAAVMMRKSRAQTKLGQGTEARQHEVPVWCRGTGLGGQGKGHDKGADRVQTGCKQLPILLHTCIPHLSPCVPAFCPQHGPAYQGTGS